MPPTWAGWKARNARRPWYVRGPLAVEWGLEWFYHRLRGLALFDLLELAGRCTILVIAIFWLLEADDRTKERHYRAWELINSARGSTGEGGRKDALQDLNRDGVSLAIAPLEKAYLPGVDLGGADLMLANLERADLKGANLKGAKLVGADLEDADLWKANLERADLWKANLERAVLWGANLKGAYLGDTDLAGTVLFGANLKGANLKGANLAGARLAGADLFGANLAGTVLFGANLKRESLTQEHMDMLAGRPDPRLENAKSLTQEQLNAATGDERTQLPEGLTRPAHWSTAPAEEPPPATEK